ncbi:hypothetical protein GCM10023192_33170 [Amycolatopsis samaneae]
MRPNTLILAVVITRTQGHRTDYMIECPAIFRFRLYHISDQVDDAAERANALRTWADGALTDRYHRRYRDAVLGTKGNLRE